MKTMKSSLKKLPSVNTRTAIIGICAVLAGIVNGFLGTGGGIVLMFALSLIPAKSDDDGRDRFATLIAVILPLSLISVFTYGEAASLKDSAPYIIPGIIGGIIGAVLLDKINVNLLKRLFAIMVLWAGINFLR